MLEAIAYVDVNGASDLMHFAETVAVNRGLPIAVFSTIADAETWLLKEQRSSSETHAAADVDNSRR
jgi:hypothetical protein